MRALVQGQVGLGASVRLGASLSGIIHELARQAPLHLPPDRRAIQLFIPLVQAEMHAEAFPGSERGFGGKLLEA